jgi:hypothetical protein
MQVQKKRGFDDFWQRNKAKILGMGRWAGLDDQEMVGEAWLSHMEGEASYDPTRRVSREGWALRLLQYRCRRWRAGERFGVELDVNDTPEIPDLNDPLSILITKEDEREEAVVIEREVKRLAARGGTVAAVILAGADGLDVLQISGAVGITPRRVNQILSTLTNPLPEGIGIYTSLTSA